ncbi:MAG: DUF4267 domain-containing protein [Pseudoclavibacter sp.]
MQLIAVIGTIATALFITGIGLGYLIRPTAMAPSFGFRDVAPAHDPFWNVKGVRDVASGVIVTVLLLFGNPLVNGAALLAAALIPLGDMLVVLANGGKRGTAFGVHGASAVIVAAVGVCWLLV